MYKNQLKTIDTEDKAYLLGLFYSDGCVCNTNNNCSIVLHNNDLNLLKILNKKFKFFKLRSSHKNATKLDCTSKELKKDLISNGVYPIKSSLNKDKIVIPNIHSSLISHFIRGFFDGDGSVYKQKLFNIKVELGCTSYGFITQLLKILYNNNINFNIQCSFKGTGLRTMDYYKIYCSSYKQSKKFADFIYKDATIFMKRKYDLLNTEIFYDKKERLQCLNCDSFNTIFMGIRNNKTRLYCKDCNTRCTTSAPVISNINSGEVQITN